MSIQTDVLVCGAGAAGAVAAARAKERGLQVIWVAKSLGATGYSLGAVDVPVFNELEERDLSQAFALFQALTEKLALTRIELAATQMGTIKRCLMVQKSQAFDLSLCSKEALLGVVEFSGVMGFEAVPVAKMLCYHGFRAQALKVDLGPLKKTRWESFLDFAKDFEQPELQQACLEALRRVQARFEHLFLPAILGLQAPTEFLSHLKASELLGLSHSIPGLRLGHCLSLGAIKTTVKSFQQDKHLIREVTLETGEILRPKSVILATGRFLSGGFVDQREVIFGLPVMGQELRVDEQQRPLNSFGEIFATNLFAAGSNLGEGGMGRAIFTGYQAGSLC